MNVQTVTGPIGLDQLGRTLMHEHLFIAFPGAEFDPSAQFDRTEFVSEAVRRLRQLRTRSWGPNLCRSLPDRTRPRCRDDAGDRGKIRNERGVHHGLLLRGNGAASLLARAVLPRKSPNCISARSRTGSARRASRQAPSRSRPGRLRLRRWNTSFWKRPAWHRKRRTCRSLRIRRMARRDRSNRRRSPRGGVPAHRCLIGHCCGNADPAYHRRVVDGGSYIGFDRIGILRFQPDEVRADNLVRLVKSGHRAQILMSQDRHCGWLGKFARQLSAGGTGSDRRPARSMDNGRRTTAICSPISFRC